METYPETAKMLNVWQQLCAYLSELGGFCLHGSQASFHGLQLL